MGDSSSDDYVDLVVCCSDGFCVGVGGFDVVVDVVCKIQWIGEVKVQCIGLWCG